MPTQVLRALSHEPPSSWAHVIVSLVVVVAILMALFAVWIATDDDR